MSNLNLNNLGPMGAELEQSWTCDLCVSNLNCNGYLTTTLPNLGLTNQIAGAINLGGMSAELDQAWLVNVELELRVCA